MLYFLHKYSFYEPAEKDAEYSVKTCGKSCVNFKSARQEFNMAKDKVILAYSGGLDTTVIIP